MDPATIELKEEVRQMCAACGKYGKCWSCPPGCGTLEACAARISAYRQGILVQTTGLLEDEFDVEIPDRVIGSMKTVGDVMDFLSAQ